MLSVQSPALLNNVFVKTTSGRGFTPEEIADMAVDKIIYVGENVHPLIREQALAYKKQVHAVLVKYLNEAVSSYKTTLSAKIKATGNTELLELLKD